MIKQSGSIILQKSDVPLILQTFKANAEQNCAHCDQRAISQSIDALKRTLSAIYLRGGLVIPQEAPTSPAIAETPTQPQAPDSLAESWARDRAAGGRKTWEAAERSALINEAFR